jgi:hypothetical protein
VVGPICGNDQHKKAVSIAIREHKYREAERIADTILLDLMENFSAWQTYYNGLRDAVNQMFILHKNFKNAAPKSVSTLGKIEKNGGGLEIIIRHPGYNEMTNAYENAVTDSVGVLLGGGFFLPKLPALAEMKRAQEILNPHFGVGTTQDDLIETVCNAEDEQKLQDLQKLLAKGIDSLNRTHECVDRDRRALLPESLNLIKIWGRDMRSYTDFRLEYTVFEGVIRIFFPYDGRARFSITESELQALKIDKPTPYKPEEKSAA